MDLSFDQINFRPPGIHQKNIQIVWITLSGIMWLNYDIHAIAEVKNSNKITTQLIDITGFYYEMENPFSKYEVRYKIKKNDRESPFSPWYVFGPFDNKFNIIIDQRHLTLTLNLLKFTFDGTKQIIPKIRYQNEFHYKEIQIKSKEEKHLFTNEVIIPNIPFEISLDLNGFVLYKKETFYLQSYSLFVKKNNGLVIFEDDSEYPLKLIFYMNGTLDYEFLIQVDNYDGSYDDFVEAKTFDFRYKNVSSSIFKFIIDKKEFIVKKVGIVWEFKFQNKMYRCKKQLEMVVENSLNIPKRGFDTGFSFQ